MSLYTSYNCMCSSLRPDFKGIYLTVVLLAYLLHYSTSLKLQGLNSVHKSLSNGLLYVPPKSQSHTSISSPESDSSTTSPSQRDNNDDDNSYSPSPGLLAALNLKWNPKQTKDYHKLQSYPKPEVLEELECTQTMFMSPFHDIVEFSLNSSIYKRIEKKCRWGFIGTEPCIPSLSCDTTQMGNCEDEYLEIVDGHKGYQKICFGHKVVDVIASHDLRDLFIHYIVIKAPNSEEKETKDLLKCRVRCSSRGVGISLPHSFTSKSNPKCYCGTKPNDDRIVNGENAKKFEFPWLVALVETNTRQPFCGGSIINNRFILSAGIKGKFVDYRNIQVVINGHEFDVSPNSNIIRDLANPKKYPLEELEKLDRQNGSMRYNIQEIIVHPLYVAENNDFDISLLKLQTALNLTPKPKVLTEPVILQQPRAICLPPINSYLRTYSNKKAIVAGWGLPDIDAVGTPQILQRLEVNVFSPKKCKDLFAHRVNRRMICAGHAEGGKDSCSGDSGGPLVLEERPKVWMQIGSVSWGEGCAEVGHPGVYFRTTEGIQWINYISNYYANVNDTEYKEDEKSAIWCLVP